MAAGRRGAGRGKGGDVSGPGAPRFLRDEDRFLVGVGDDPAPFGADAERLPRERKGGEEDRLDLPLHRLGTARPRYPFGEGVVFPQGGGLQEKKSRPREEREPLFDAVAAHM